MGPVGRDPDTPPPEPSRSPRALTGQEQHTGQSEPPHGLHGGRGDNRRAPGAAAPRSRARPAPPPIPLERPRPSPSALSAPDEGGAVPLRPIAAHHAKHAANGKPGEAGSAAVAANRDFPCAVSCGRSVAGADWRAERRSANGMRGVAWPARPRAALQ